VPTPPSAGLPVPPRARARPHAGDVTRARSTHPVRSSRGEALAVIARARSARRDTGSTSESDSAGHPTAARSWPRDGKLGPVRAHAGA
jgi:hypothetical protein